jgi:hypothetical protein
MSTPGVLRSIQRSLGLLLAAALLAFVPQLALPRPAVACSCIGPQPLEQYAKDGSVIIAGRVVGRDAVGVQVAVDRWFAGRGAAQAVWITGDFGNGASCGVGAEPPVNSQWLWVAWQPDGEPGLRISICAPTGDLATPEGQALLAEAEATFGEVGIVFPGSGGPAPASPGASDEEAVDEGMSDDEADGIAVVAAAIVVVALGILVLGGVVIVARRRHTA